MSENLKVNANSSVLEHKRKHNLLTDEVLGIENGNVEIPNAKPIYCHPIYCTFKRLRENVSILMTFTCLIFNNDETPFTADTFFDWVKALFTDYPNASIMASGYVENAPVSRIQNGFGSNLQLQVPQFESGSYVNQFWNFIKTDLTLESTVFIDGVNKIN